MKPRISTAFKILKRVGFAVLFCAQFAAQAQDWNTPIQVASGHLFAGPYMVIDSLNRIHMFVVQSRDSVAAQPNTLHYYLLDNWGRPLREDHELLPDTHWVDHNHIGVLLDSQERIHVVWLRQFDDGPATRQLIYVRMNLEGEFLQEPLIYEVPGNQPYGIEPGNYHLLETVTGEIWAACDDHFFVFVFNGNLVEHVQHIVAPPAIGSIRMAAAPDGSVWGTFRKIDSNSDTLKTVRYWPPPRIEENTLTNESPGFGADAFYIDQYGSFHYVIATEDSGLFYRFDPRGMGLILTTVFDPFPYGVGKANSCRLVLTAYSSCGGIHYLLSAIIAFVSQRTVTWPLAQF